MQARPYPCRRRRMLAMAAFALAALAAAPSVKAAPLSAGNAVAQPHPPASRLGAQSIGHRKHVYPRTFRSRPHGRYSHRHRGFGPRFFFGKGVHDRRFHRFGHRGFKHRGFRHRGFYGSYGPRFYKY